MSNERKRSWERDEFDDEDEILGTKKGKIVEIDDEDALLLNDDEDDDLLRNSDDSDNEEKIPEIKKSNGESEIPDLKQKVRHHSTKSSTNDEANFEEELDYDEDFSDDDEGKKRGRFRNERTESDIKKKPTGDSSTKEIPDTLEITPEVEEKIAKFDEEKKNKRHKKFAPSKDAKNNGTTKTPAPPVIRYGGPPPHLPAPLTRMPPLPGPPPQLHVPGGLPGGKKILVNPKFRNKVNPTVTQPISTIAPPNYRAPPPMYSAPPPGFTRPPYSIPPGAPPPPGAQMPPSMVGVPPPMMPPRPFK